MTDKKPDPMNLAFVGLGVMGFPMAGHLATHGHHVTVYNRTQSKAQRWLSCHGHGRVAGTPREAVQGADMVFMCLGNDNDLRSVVYGDSGVLAGLGEGAVLVDHTTASALVAREFSSACHTQKACFLDAPVSGGQSGAENGKLTIMCGGEESVFLRVSPVLQAYAKSATLMGSAGAGQLTKMVNQICIAGALQGLSEALHFSRKADLDGQRVLDVISGGAAQSWQMDNRGRTMLEDRFDFGFAVDWMRKDLGLLLDESRKNGALLPMTALVDQFYAEVQSMGGGRWDTSSLIRRLERQGQDA